MFHFIARTSLRFGAPPVFSKPSSFEIRRQLSMQRTCPHPNGRNNVLKQRPGKDISRDYPPPKDQYKPISVSFLYLFMAGIGRMVNSQMKVTKMLLIVSSVFVCLNLPSYLMRVRAFIEVRAIRYVFWYGWGKAKTCYWLLLVPMTVNISH